MILDAARVIELISRTSGYNDKLYLLKKNENVPALKEILYFIYNPYYKTGISSAKLNKAFSVHFEPYVVGKSHFISYKDIISYLKKHNTGSDTDLAMAARFINCTKTEAEYELNNTNSNINIDFVVLLAKAIITQDLQIGVTAKSLNTVYGRNFIPTVGCMLGTKLQSVPLKNVKWPCIVTEKLDGVRRILIKENGICRFFSRSGHEDTMLVELLEEARYLPDNRVYDGELLAEGLYTNSIALRQATNSIANLKGEKRGLIFNIFDMVNIDDFYENSSDDTAEVRKLLLGATLMDESIQYIAPLLDTDWARCIAGYGINMVLPHIKPVRILGVVQSLEEVDPIVAAIWNMGGEGVMLNTATGLYQIKRSKELIKVKHTSTLILPIIDLLEGSGKYDGMLGALVVQYKNSYVGVGSGFTDYERLSFWKLGNAMIGKKIEIETFGESTNQSGGISLNCPIFKRVIGDE